MLAAWWYADGPSLATGREGGALAQSLKSWGRHNESAYCSLGHKMTADSRGAHPSLNRILKDLEAYYAFGEKHAPPGQDRQPFLRVMSDVGQAVAAIKAGNEQAFDTAMTNAQNDSNDLPVYIPSGC